MSYEERGTWVYLVVSAGVYAAYVAVVLAGGVHPLAESDYQVPLLVSIGAAMVAAIVLRIVMEIAAGVVRGGQAGTDPLRADARDREIDRLGTLRTWWVVAAGALAALVMALAEWPPFWIANVIYLGFVLQAVSSSIVKLAAYRRGL
ncbi:hypothetical protein N1031_06170 [Herbiconiux moechotypicola]|uniref:Integral membrane protein n=1 Tax=Herbiconiux moechotypicola TaxID=637393 RepID=A0ABP5Q929_9MICO|nr:hypothetical protein [Herbiconiux moechotypicola]MCS5729342.1 hypothetical protein [Herbiconiux moechotypicola]